MAWDIEADTKKLSLKAECARLFSMNEFEGYRGKEEIAKEKESHKRNNNQTQSVPPLCGL